MYSLNCCNCMACLPICVEIHLTMTGMIVKRTDIEINIVFVVVALFHNVRLMRSYAGGTPQISDQFQRIVQGTQFSLIIEPICCSSVMIDSDWLVTGNQSNMAPLDRYIHSLSLSVQSTESFRQRFGTHSGPA